MRIEPISPSQSKKCSWGLSDVDAVRFWQSLRTAESQFKALSRTAYEEKWNALMQLSKETDNGETESSMNHDMEYVLPYWLT